MISKLVAPVQMPWFLAMKLAYEGRRDAKVYPDHLSGTHTDATRRIESEYQQNQLELNNVLAQKIEPLLDGIRAIEVQIAGLDRQIQAQHSRSALTARERKQILESIQALQAERDNNRLQRISNAEAVRAAIQSFTAANESWVRYFKQSASMYQASLQRTKMKRSKIPLVTAAAMTLPTFESVPLQYPDGFEEAADSAALKRVD